MSHQCDHSCDGHSSLVDSEEMGILYSLYSKIDLGKVECLNETVEGSGKFGLILFFFAIVMTSLSLIIGKTVFKAWSERLDMEKFVLSDCDQELLFKIP